MIAGQIGGDGKQKSVKIENLLRFGLPEKTHKSNA